MWIGSENCRPQLSQPRKRYYLSVSVLLVGQWISTAANPVDDALVHLVQKEQIVGAQVFIGEDDTVGTLAGHALRFPGSTTIAME